MGKYSQYDFSQCEFESLYPGKLPLAVRQMIERALSSFGLDSYVIANRWNRPTRGSETRSEGAFFPHAKTDICCADTAAWVLYQTGAMKEGIVENLWPVPNAEQASLIYGCSLKESEGPDKRGLRSFHSATYWMPWEGNKTHIRLVARYAKDGDKGACPAPAKPGTELVTGGKLVHPEQLLPGDYFLYSTNKKERQHPLGEPSHINVYLGPFRIRSGKAPATMGAVNGVYSMINGSLGEDGRNACITPRGIAELEDFYLEHGWTIWHCRAVAIEKLYRASAISMPFAGHASPEWLYFCNEKMHGGHYPVGQFDNIHSGIHLLPKKPDVVSEDDKAKDQERAVHALAAGYIVAMRFPDMLSATAAVSSAPADKKGSDDHAGETPNELCRRIMGSDNGFVLIRHAITKKPKKSESGDNGSSNDHNEASHLIYSLYMHLRTPVLRPRVEAVVEREVRWLKRLFHRYGSVTVLSEGEAPCVRRWLTKKSATTGLAEGGRYEVFKDDLSGTETLDLDHGGTPGAAKDLAFLRGPELELDELYERLAKGEVVTFDEPFLYVKEGDVIGVVDETSQLGRGFVHLETFTVGPGSMSKLLSYLDDLLPSAARLPRDFFKTLEDTKDDNVLDDEELVKVAANLPAADAEEKVKLGHKVAPSFLNQLLKVQEAKKKAKEQDPNDPPQLAFDAECDTKGFFDSTLVVRNYMDLVPKKSHAFEVACTGGGFARASKEGYSGAAGWEDVAFKVPGGTTRLTLNGGPDLFFDEDLESVLRSPDEDEIARRMTFFCRLAQARWRNSIVAHLNPWSKKGLTANLRAVAASNYWALPDDPNTEPRSDQERIDAYVNAVYWWGQNGGEGKVHEVFGEKKLAADARLEAIHPVTLAWLLRILEYGDLIDVVRPTPWHGDASERVSHLGWANAPSRSPQVRAGETLRLLAVQECEPDEESPAPLKLNLECGGKKWVAANGYFTQGTYKGTSQLQVFGRVKLSADGSASVVALVPPSVKPEGDPLELEVLEPVIKALQNPTKKGLEYAAVILVEKNLPVRLSGWVVFKNAAGEMTGPSHSFAFVATPKMAWQPVKGIIADHDIITALPGGHVQLTNNFWSDELIHLLPKDKFRFSGRLLAALQTIRDQTDGRSLSLSALSDDGLQIDASLQRLVIHRAPEGYSALWLFFDAWQQEVAPLIAPFGVELTVAETSDRTKSLPRIHLTDKRLKEAGGELAFTFNVGDAVDAATALSKDSPDADRAEMNVGVRIYNGVPFDFSPVDDDAGSDPWAAVADSSLSMVEQWAPDPISVVVKPHAKTPPTLMLVPNSPGLAQVTLELLGGDDAYWKAAKPTLVLQGHDKGVKHDIKRVSKQGERRQVSCTFPMGSAAYRKALSFHFKVKKANYQTREIPELDRKVLSYDNSKRKGEWVRPASGKAKVKSNGEAAVAIEVSTKGVASNDLCELVRIDAEGRELALGCVAYTEQGAPVTIGTTKRRVGRCDENGCFKASLVLNHDFNEYTEGGALKFKLKVRDAKGNLIGDLDVSPLDVTIEAAKPPEEEPPRDFRLTPSELAGAPM